MYINFENDFKWNPVCPYLAKFLHKRSFFVVVFFSSSKYLENQKMTFKVLLYYCVSIFNLLKCYMKNGSGAFQNVFVNNNNNKK